MRCENLDGFCNYYLSGLREAPKPLPKKRPMTPLNTKTAPVIVAAPTPKAAETKVMQEAADTTDAVARRLVGAGIPLRSWLVLDREEKGLRAAAELGISQILTQEQTDDLKGHRLSSGDDAWMFAIFTKALAEHSTIKTPPTYRHDLSPELRAEGEEILKLYFDRKDVTEALLKFSRKPEVRPQLVLYTKEQLEYRWGIKAVGDNLTSPTCLPHTIMALERLLHSTLISPC